MSVSTARTCHPVRRGARATRRHCRSGADLGERAPEGSFRRSISAIVPGSYSWVRLLSRSRSACQAGSSRYWVGLRASGLRADFGDATARAAAYPVSSLAGHSPGTGAGPGISGLVPRGIDGRLEGDLAQEGAPVHGWLRVGTRRRGPALCRSSRRERNRGSYLSKVLRVSASRVCSRWPAPSRRPAACRACRPWPGTRAGGARSAWRGNCSCHHSCVPPTRRKPRCLPDQVALAEPLAGSSARSSAKARPGHWSKACTACGEPRRAGRRAAPPP